MSGVKILGWGLVALNLGWFIIFTTPFNLLSGLILASVLIWREMR